MYELEKQMAFAINMGYITSFEMFIKELTKIYNQNQKLRITNRAPGQEKKNVGAIKFSAKLIFK